MNLLPSSQKLFWQVIALIFVTVSGRGASAPAASEGIAGEIFIQPVSVETVFGQTNILTVPILASGLGVVSDMAITLELKAADSSAPVPLRFSTISFTNSLWNALPGGDLQFQSELPSSIVRVSAAALEANQSVAATGELFRVNIDIGGVAAGSYSLLVSTNSGATAFYNANQPVTYRATTGSVSIKPAVVEALRMSIRINESKRIELAFKAQTGKHYQVQTTTALGTEAWTAVGASILGTGQAVQWQDDSSAPLSPGNARKFYRILETIN